MKLATMHKADYWVGSLATFFISMALKLKRLFVPAKKVFPAEVKNILFIELSEMGSVVLLCPLVDRVKKEYPSANIYFVTFGNVAPAVTLLPQMDKEKIFQLRITTPGNFVQDLCGVLLKLSRISFDITFDLELFSRISSLLSIYSAAPVRVGFSNFLAEGLYRGNFLTHPVTYNPHLHITKNFLSMFYALKEPWDDIPHSKRTITNEETRLPEMTFAKEDIDRFRSKLFTAYPALEKAGRLVVLNPNSSLVMPLRRWPLESYLALARRLIEMPDVAIVITGTAEERKDAAFMCGGLPAARAIDLTGFTTLAELIALYHLSSLLVSNDSGPAHFSALSPIPSIILFGPETPDLYGSLSPRSHPIYKHLQCSPCSTAYNQRRSPCKNNVCVKSITVDEVYDKAVSLLQSA